MRVDTGIIIKLIIWSFLVGAFLYWMEWSPGDVYGWLANRLAGLWEWVSGTGLQYVLLGATIVVPVFLILQFKRRGRG
jgi:hypothetical protein